MSSHRSSVVRPVCVICLSVWRLTAGRWRSDRAAATAAGRSVTLYRGARRGSSPPDGAGQSRQQQPAPLQRTRAARWSRHWLQISRPQAALRPSHVPTHFRSGLCGRLISPHSTQMWHDFDGSVHEVDALKSGQTATIFTNNAGYCLDQVSRLDVCHQRLQLHFC